MDANGTKFYLLFGKNDWGSCLDGQELLLSSAWNDNGSGDNTTNLNWDVKANELTLKPILYQHVASPSDQPPRLDDRRGAGRDQYGNWYWIDDTRTEIRVLSAGTGVTSHFWSAEDLIGRQRETAAGDFKPVERRQLPEQVQFSGLTVTEDHFLVVGLLDPAGILIFDLHSVGHPEQLLWPETIGFVPFDMAPKPGGGVWILDRDNLRYWSLDRYFNVCGEDQVEETLVPETEHDFQPSDGSSVRSVKRRTFPWGISLDLSSPVLVNDPIAIEALPDGTVLILDGPKTPDQRFSIIYRYRYSQMLGSPRSTEPMVNEIEKNLRPEFRLIAYDFAFVAEQSDTGAKILGQLYFADRKGNQAYAFDFELVVNSQNGSPIEQFELKPVSEFFPMRLFGGKALVAACQRVFYDSNERWISLIKQRRSRYVSNATLYTPHTVSNSPEEPRIGPIDGQVPNCIWHRLLLDASIPPQTNLTVESRAANRWQDLVNRAWRKEPNPYMRSDGSELPYASAAVGEYRGTWELLFQHSRGQYLQLRINLRGDGHRTPRLRALRVYYPRFSYLQNYLPAVYRQEEQSASFLDRFLANFEGFYTAIEDKIATVHILFDTHAAPAEVLEWLASWFEVALDPTWSEVKRRLFIRHAVNFFHYRGTIPGILMALHLAFDDDDCIDETILTEPEEFLFDSGEIRIIERYRSRLTPGVVFGDPSDGVRGPRLRSFAARWKPQDGREELNRRYNEYLQSDRFEAFPITRPGAERADAWQQFALSNLGFVPSAAISERTLWRQFLESRYDTIDKLNQDYGSGYERLADVPLPKDQPIGRSQLEDWHAFFNLASQQPAANRRRWQLFLERRYQTIGKLNDAHGTRWPGFDWIALPDTLPESDSVLQDWFQFESVVLAMHATAHHFRVLLPANGSRTFNALEPRKRLDWARRIVNLEKPAHTLFEVNFYWAMFRVGEARLGEDTAIDTGSRVSQLLNPFVLGQEYLAEGTLAPTYPQDISDRRILGRDQIE